MAVRYADNIILGIQYQTDADRFLKNLRERLAKLELRPRGTFPAAITLCFIGNAGLRYGISDSAFPSTSHSDPDEAVLFRGLTHGLLTLRPVALLALLPE